MPPTVLFDQLRARQQVMVEGLATLVSHESPSADKPALDSLARQIAARFQAIGCQVTTIERAEGGNHLRLLAPSLSPPTRSGPAPSQAPVADDRPALILCHFDTVWPVGTLNQRPFRLAAGRAYGPGSFDMKASFILVEEALRAIRSLGLAPPRPITALFTSDEEIGSPSSRALIEAAAQGAAYVLVLESPLAGGRLKTARKGVGRFTVELVGRAAHAGIEPEKGISAVVELAYQILAITQLADPAAGTTLNVGVVQGGTTPNVVPERASARVDVRVTTMAEAARLERALGALKPVLPGAVVQATGGFSRPPMERTPAVADLYERARAIAHSLGQELTEGSTGGASDGNFTAALGVPTLDGLGALGAGAHAEDEHIVVDSLPERAALLAGLLLGL